MKENFKEKLDYQTPMTKTFDIGAASAILQDITASGGATGTIDPWGEGDDDED